MLADRQAILNAANAVGRFVPGDAVVSLSRHASGDLCVSAISEDGTCGAEQTVVGVQMSDADLALSLPALRAVCRYADGNSLNLRESQDTAVFECGSSTHTLTLTPPADVPETPAADAGSRATVSLTLGPACLTKLFTRVRHATGPRREDSSAWATDAVRLDAKPGELTLTTSDAISMATARASVPCKGKAQFLLPREVVRRWAVGSHANEKSTLTLHPTLSVVTTDDGVRAWAQPATGEFPPLMGLDLKLSHAIPFPRQLRAALAVVKPDDDIITLSIGRGFIELATGQARSRVTIPKHAGPPAEIELDGKRLVRAVMTYTRLSDPLTLRYSGSAQPITLMCGNATYALAPHRLHEQAAA